jgi:uncharacterized Zn-binding protein involved in type VI secretion
MTPAAKQGDRVVALDNHLIQPPPPAATVPVPHPFTGVLDGQLSADVRIEGKAAATVGSTATNQPSHVPIGGTFVNPPSNRAEVTAGSRRVKINGKAAARLGDQARTCNDGPPYVPGVVVASGKVLIGD